MFRAVGPTLGWEVPMDGFFRTAPPRLRRRHSRHDLQRQLWVYRGARRLGWVADLSTAGMLLLAKEAMVAGQEVTLRIDLTPIRGLADEPMQMPCLVRWCERQASDWRVGLEFDGVDLREVIDLELIIRFIGSKASADQPWPLSAAG